MTKSFFGKMETQFQPITKVGVRPSTAPVMHGICWEDLGCVQIVSNDFYLKASLADVLLDQQADVCFSNDLESLEHSNVLLVDIDSLGGISWSIDQLLVLRAQRRSRITILLSAEFSSDDFDANRLWVCDASLRLPFSFARLEQAFVEADNNNLVWQDEQVRPALAVRAPQSLAIAR